MKIKQMHCGSCRVSYEVDLDETPFSSQFMIVNGKTNESRAYMTTCPHCDAKNVFQSENREEWGHQKGVNFNKLKFMLLSGCLLVFILIALIFYFAGQGVVTIVNWIMG